MRRSRPDRALACWVVLAFVLCLPAHTYAYRPFVSTDAAVAGPQEMEVELGYFELERSEGQNTFTVPHLVLNYGFIRDWEIVGEFMLSKSADTDVQIVDPSVSLKAVVKEGVLQEHDGLSVATEAELLLPSTASGESGFGFEGSGILSGQLSALTVHLNFGGGVRRERTDLFGLWGLIAEWPVRRSLRLVGEVNGESSQEERATNSGLLGFIWQPLAADLFIDAGLRRGISHDAPDWAFTTGVTFTFPVLGHAPA